jgi:hypothetical protein
MTAKKPRRSRRQALREFSAEQRERDQNWLQRRKANLLIDHAEQVFHVEQRYARLRADLEATRAATEELAALRAVGDVTLH